VTICGPCKAAGKLLMMSPGLTFHIKHLHGECPGGTWCSCQHQSDRSVLRGDRKADPRRGG